MSDLDDAKAVRGMSTRKRISVPCSACGSLPFCPVWPGTRCNHIVIGPSKALETCGGSYGTNVAVAIDETQGAPDA